MSERLEYLLMATTFSIVCWGYIILFASRLVNAAS